MNRAELREQGLVDVGYGTLVERDVLNISEKVRAYDPNLSIQYCPDPSSISDAPYRLVERCRDGGYRVVFNIWTLDDTVIQRIYEHDNAKHDIDKMLTDTNRKAKDNQKKEFKESMAEAHDIAAHAIRTPKSRYTVRQGEKVITFE